MIAPHMSAKESEMSEKIGFTIHATPKPRPAPVSGDAIRAEGAVVLVAIDIGRYEPDDAVTLASRLLQEAAKARHARDAVKE